MIDIEKTFQKENRKEIKGSLGEKIFLLNNNNIMSFEGESLFIYNIENLQLITKFQFDKRILDIIQLKTEEILVLTPCEITMMDGKSYKILSKRGMKGKNYDMHYGDVCESSPERMFQLSDSTIAFVYNAAFNIDICQKSEQNQLIYIKTIETKGYCYSACEIGDNNIAFNSTENYKIESYDILFSHNDKIIKDLYLSVERDALFYSKEKNLLAAIGVYLYFIDLNKYEVIKEYPIGRFLVGGNYIDFKVYKNYIFVSVYNLYIFDLENLELTKMFDFKIHTMGDWLPPVLRTLFLDDKAYLYFKGRLGGYHKDYSSGLMKYSFHNRFTRIYNIIYK